MKIYRNFILLVMFVSVTCCSGNKTDSYFPLDDGITWQYAITQKTTGDPYHYKYLVTTIDDEKIDGQVVYPRRDHNGTVTYYRIEDTGILLFGRRINDENILRDQPGKYLIRFPLKIGTEWKQTTRPYLTEKMIQEINNMQNSMPGLSLVKPLNMHYQIESIDDIVEVPAGRYHNCLRIRGAGQCSFTSSGSFAKHIVIDVEHKDWYCPDVGLVKTERYEVDQSGVLQPSTYKSELERTNVRI